MFLKRVTVTGFKSFAAKTVLDLEPGVTAVVGPNGSGKSNLADAVRWALGEQNKSRLRLTDRDEVVFAGSEKRARASFAEVVLLFDNESGAFPLELTEVEISRRLYRSGETDYRLAGRSVRLADIQALLAQTGFGAGTYAVIGQGMIDSFLQSPPAERKQLFDEAVGIRGPELGREAALRKLDATSANLTRLRDIAAELAPRLDSLKGSVEAQQTARELDEAVDRLRRELTGAKIAHWTSQLAVLAQRAVTVKESAQRFQSERAGLERKLSEEESKETQSRRENEKLQSSLVSLEQERDQLGMELATSRTAMSSAESALARVSELSRALSLATEELAKARTEAADLEAEFTSNSDAAAKALRAVERTGRAVSEAQAALVTLRRSATDTSRDQYVDHALQILKLLATNLSVPDVKLEEVRLLVHKAGRLLSHAGDTGAAGLLNRLKAAQKSLESAMTKRETAVEHQTNITITSRSLEIDLNHQKQAVERASTVVSELESSISDASVLALGLPELKTTTRQLNASIDLVTRQLAQHREQSRTLSTSSSHARVLTEVATALERTRAAEAATVIERQELQQLRSTAEQQLRSAHEQAKTWNVPAVAIKSKDSFAELDSQLLRAEATQVAHSAASKDRSEEYEAVDTRYSELVTQIVDLEGAQANLQQLVSELDKRIRERFNTNFAQLSDHFSHYFTQLFGGGSAVLNLEHSDDGSYGIGIKVSPKGKRMASIAALSGGERALAGVALLAAILRTNPSPFVVLDEIDAALDEANSTRLSEILGELSKDTQLIVITHNRQTMHAARTLFGVTMNEHQVSHLLSMRLEEATSLAAR